MTRPFRETVTVVLSVPTLSAARQDAARRACSLDVWLDEVAACYLATGGLFGGPAPPAELALADPVEPSDLTDTDPGPAAAGENVAT